VAIDLTAPLIDLLALGELIAGLRCHDQDPAVYPPGEDQFSVVDRIRSVVELLARLELPDAEAMARSRLEPLAARLKSLANDHPSSTVGKENVTMLRVAATDLWRAVANEARRRTVFVVPFERDEFTESLLQDVRWAFGVSPDHPWGNVAEAVSDLEEAADCYAIGRYGAAIMFATRAVEAFFWEFWMQTFGRTPKKRLGWEQALDVLRAPTLNCPEGVLAAVEPVRRMRNKAMHGRVVGSPQRAKQVFEECRQAIEAMGKHLADRRAGQP
jgi:hypothetical protein